MVKSTRPTSQYTHAYYWPQHFTHYITRMPRTAFIGLIFLVVLFLQSSPATGQTPNVCSGNCTSGDIRITKVEIVNLDGGALPSYCDQNVPVPVKLKVYFNVTSQTRYGFLVTADLWINNSYVKGIMDCSRANFQQGARDFTTNITLDWTCGSKIELRNVFTAWDNAAPIKGNTSICDRVNKDGSLNCSIITPKCYYYGNRAEDAINVVTPVSSSFDVSYAQCSSSIIYAPITFTAAGSGGTPPYSYKWYIRDSVTHTDITASSANPFTFTPTNANNLSVKVVITDNSPTTIKKDSVTKLVTVTSCCTAPVIGSQQHPSNQLKCEGETATFTVGYTAGTPTTSIQWQEKTVNGSFVNLSNSTNTTDVPHYSGVNGPTLTISKLTTALNGRQYRAILTSGACTPAESNPANLTVRTLSTAPSGATASMPSICPGENTDISVDGGSLGTNAAWKWYTGSCGGSLVGTGASINVAPTATTTYYVRAEGDCNTTACVSVMVTVKSESVAPTGASAATPAICPGGSTGISVTGGTLGTGANWKWYKGNCTGTSIGSGSSITVEPTTNTTYYVRAEGDCNTTACASVTVTVKTPSEAPSSIVSSNDNFCPGGSTTLTLRGGALGTGASWKWYAGSCSGTPVATGASYTPSPATTTTYYVRAEGDCNTTDCVSITIAVKTLSSAPTSASSSINNFCPGTSTELSITGGSLGTGASWKWYAGSCGGAGNTLLGTGTTLSVSPSATTTYYVRAEGDCNTTTCASVTVTVKTTPGAPALAVQNNCNGTSTLTVTNYTGSLTWNDGATSASPRTVNTAGNYSVTQTVEGCASGSSNIITAAPRTAPDAPVLIAVQPSLCGPATGSLEVCSPVAGYKYQLGNSEITAQSGKPVKFDNLLPGSNPSVKVIGTNGCDATSACSTARSACPQEGTKAVTNTGEQVIAQPVNTTDINARIGSATKVLASPNPFTNKLRFTLESAVSGQGSLELYNTMGQKIATVYQGYIEAGKQLIREYNVPVNRRTTLVYVFRVGNQKTTGKLLNR